MSVHRSRGRLWAPTDQVQDPRAGEVGMREVFRAGRSGSAFVDHNIPGARKQSDKEIKR